MAFTDFPEQAQGVTLLQRSLQRGRLGHAYLFAGVQLAPLEGLARTLAKTLNCERPVKMDGATMDCWRCALGAPGIEVADYFSRSNARTDA